MEDIGAGRTLGRKGQEYRFGDDFAGLPEGSGVVAVVGAGVVLAVNLPVGADELGKADQVGRGGDGLPIEGDGNW